MQQENAAKLRMMLLMSMKNILQSTCIVAHSIIYYMHSAKREGGQRRGTFEHSECFTQKEETRGGGNAVEHVAGAGEHHEPRGKKYRAIFTVQQLVALCAIGATQKEAAAILGVTDDTINNRLKEWGYSWKEFAEEHKATTRAALRRAQFKKAMEGDTALLIHLGKAWLGQTNAKRLAHELKENSIAVHITDNEE